jgi:hypothetical protein
MRVKAGRMRRITLRIWSSADFRTLGSGLKVVEKRLERDWRSIYGGKADCEWPQGSCGLVRWIDGQILWLCPHYLVLTATASRIYTDKDPTTICFGTMGQKL